MNHEVQLYTRADLASLDWPHTPDSEYARNYLVPFIKDGPQKYIRNVHNTEMLISKIRDTILPLTITDFHPDNAYTCSPYSHYISYGGFEEVHRLKNPLLETLIKFMVLPIAGYFRLSELDRVVYVNNWLLSTNLYPSISVDELEVIALELPRRFADRAIVFRSIDNLGNPRLYNKLKEIGYEMVLSRQVWYQNPQDAQHKKQFKVDRSLLRRSKYEIVNGKQLADEEIPRALDLYNMLYLTKYSHYNPQFTKEFMDLARNQRLLFLKGIRRKGKLNGIMGYFVRNGLMTQPMFGYDTQLPQKEGLYRILSLLTIQEGLSNGLIVHASGGVGRFKKLRGGRSVIEYNAVYDRHLPSRRQLPWRLLKRVTDLAIPFFKKNDF